MNDGQGLRVQTIAERPELRDQLGRADAAAYPAFMLHTDLAELWPSVYDEFPDYQFVLHDEASEVVLAHGNSVPFVWDERLDSLPRSAVELVRAALDQRRDSVRPTTLGALQAVVHPAHQGGGLSARVLEAMAALAAERGLPDLFAPIRPNMKHRYALAPLDDYARWLRDDGLPLDPWMRVHHRLGATPVSVAPAWLVVTATIAEWQLWTGLVFRASGPFAVPGALVPVEIDVENDVGRYVEPHLWMHYRIPLWESEDAATFLRGVPLFDSLDDAEVARLAQLARVVRFPAGAVLVEEGAELDEESAAVYTIMTGGVEVYRGGAGGPLTRLRPRDCFGELALLTGRPRSASVDGRGADGVPRAPPPRLRAAAAESPGRGAEAARTPRRPPVRSARRRSVTIEAPMHRRHDASVEVVGDRVVRA